MRFPTSALLPFFAVYIAFQVMASQSDSQAGKAIYDAKCKTCHGANGEGVQAVAKALKVEFRHLGSKEVQSKSDDDLIKASIDGIGKMKPVKGIPEDRTQNLLAFLRSLAKK
ncbi:MAG: hypothetical protein A3F68_12495 [Acidobacteria bacterium RIFCSPLOWO2_12_FULL_54_10]|nr:MAG: hypothetical protein A3F68_12495 [Acidobacteria bacterium RIFCSPLOWO2_12_FULL_54_10]